MLKNRVLSTLKFFDLQDYPLTLLELHRFLISEGLRQKIDTQGEIVSLDHFSSAASLDQILSSLQTDISEAENTLGFYHLKGRGEIVKSRLSNYYYGFAREKLIKRYIKFLRFLPFVRGVGLAGSQAMGQQKPASDIDLLIITDPRFMWLSRTLVTVYFQVLGIRRHGKKIANRFCLNHYVAGPKEVGNFRNLYTALEYLKLRPLVFGQSIFQFRQNNSNWMKAFFPEAKDFNFNAETKTKIQTVLEKLFANKFGDLLEGSLKRWRLPKIKKEKFIVVEENELSFHPDSKQQALLQKFFFE